jgi:hypothetical protein
MILRISKELVLASLAVAALGLLAGCPETNPGGCEFEDQRLQPGARVSLDECNTCTCRSDFTLSCTEFTCEDTNPVTRDGGPDPEPSEDAGPPVDDCESPCVDEDEDGFYTCVDENCPDRSTVVDCDDDRFFVQPGGYEYPNNGFDDDCDENTPDDVAPCACTFGEDPTAENLVNALDLCDSTVGSVSKTGDVRQFAVMTDYFGDVFPEEGDCLAVLSNGVADSDEVQSFGPENLCGGGGFSGCFADPDPENPGEDVWDLGQIRVTLFPPPNAKGVEFRFMFLSAEWPEFLCQSFNDTFYSLYESEAVNAGDVTNISFDPQQQQITVNVGFFEAPRDWSTSLDNTPFGESDQASCGFPSAPECVLPGYCGTSADLDRVGSGSGWLTTRAPFEPGEESIDLVFSIHDEGDGILSSVVLLDSLKWVPFRPPVGTVKE